MLRRGRGRPRKQVSCSNATLTLSRKVKLRRIGKVLCRKRLNLRRQKILELATINFCSTITRHRNSLRDLKHFARQLGKRTVPPVYPYYQQRASNILEDCKSSPQCRHDHGDWNSSESGDIATKTTIFEDAVRSKEDEFPFDAHMDHQWVGVEVLLFGRKSSIGEVGSTTSNVCDKLRSVVANPEGEHVYASFAKTRNKEEGREWPSSINDGIVPSWVSCRRSITRNRQINATGGISDCHITALLASLPMMGSYIDGKATTINNISSIEENGLDPCTNEGTLIPMDQSSATTIITMDESSATIIPIKQSFTSQESIVNFGKGSSLDLDKEKQDVNIFVLQMDAIQVCPTTPEKAQKRRRNYQDTISNNDSRDMDDCEPSNGIVTIGDLDLRPTVDDKNVKESGDGLLVMENLDPYSIDFESNCNSIEIGKHGLNFAVVECTRLLVNSIPTPTIADPLGSISHEASVIIDQVQESSQLFQTHVPSAIPVVAMESKGRKEKHDKSKSNKDSSSMAMIPKVRRKYKPRVAKVKQTDNSDKCCENRLQTKPSGNIRDHGVSKHARIEVVCQEINRGGMQRGTSVRDSCISKNTLCGNHEEYSGTIEEGRNLLFQEEIIGLKIGEMVSKPVTTSLSHGETLSSIDNTCLTRNVLEGPHPHGPFNLGQDTSLFDSLLCRSCGLKWVITSDRFETEQANILSPPNKDETTSNSFIERQKHFEALSFELSNRVLALLDLPSIGQPHSLYTITGELEQSPSIQSPDISMCYNKEDALKEDALKEYPQATYEDGFSSFSEEWIAYHAGSIEMTALNAFNEEEMSFDMFYNEQQSAVSEDNLFQTLSAELNEYYSAIVDTWVDESPFIEDHCGGNNLSSNLQCELEELGYMQLDSSPQPVQRSLMAQMVSPELVEDRTMSSFYASTSTGVNNIMFSRLNKMIEENVQKNAYWDENVEQDLNIDVRPNCRQTKASNTCWDENAKQDLNMDVRPHCSQALNTYWDKNTKQDLNMDVRLDCDETVAPSTCLVQRCLEGFKERGLLGDYSLEEEDLMKLRNTVPCQMCSQFQSLDLDPNSTFVIENIVLPTDDNHEMTKNNLVPCQFSFQYQDADPNSNFAGESAIEVNNDLEDCNYNILSADNATLNKTCTWKDVCSTKISFYLMTFVQLVAFMKIILVDTLEMSPLTLLGHIQDHLPEEERVEFEKLWPMILHLVSSERLQKLIDLTEIDLSSCMEWIQYYQRITRQDDGAKEDNHLVPCMELVQYQQIERQDDRAKDDNHVTDLVPYIGNNVVVAYNGSFFPLPKRKSRPKVNLDIETIRVWKLLMGKAETTENNHDVDNELKWKQERLIMQEQAETFIRRMHLIQGDRSFSRWKGSVVDSVIGVFLTQNVSDVLSSSAFMCLRARFPHGGGSRGPLQSKSQEGDEEIFQNDIQINLGSFQTFQESQTSYSHEVLSNCASTSLANEGREEICNPQECCYKERNISNLEIRQVDTLLFPENESYFSYTLKRQQEEILQSEQPPTTNTSMNVLAGVLELNVHGITNMTCYENANASDVVIRREDPGFLASSLRQGDNNIELNTHCIINAEYNLTKEVVMSNLESQLELLLLQQEKAGANGTFTRYSLTKELQREENLSTSIHMQKEVLTGIERARLEAEHVRARKSTKWDALAEKYNARCQQAAMDMDVASSHTEMTHDGVDWEAVRRADLEEIADAIKERGMNWKLAGRIKGFLERLRLEQGGLDLEWLRSIPSDDAKEFLSSVHGLGLKSVECIRLLTLHHLAFPVDTNVGRICVRLGWVPLEPLPEELQLHVLELYPVQATIQKYLWPRLCTLDQQTLYELHYQLITFGKVFCTKSKPNCNACPMRPDCKHFASALSSAKLALPPSEGSSGSGAATLALPPGSSTFSEELGAAPQTAQPSISISQYNCQPIIEEPMTPESEADMSECDIEDYPFSVEEIAHESMMELIIQEIQGRQELTLQQQQLDNYSNRTCCKATSLSESESVQMADLETLAHDTVPAPPKVVSEDLEELGNDCYPSTRATTLFDDAPSREVVMLPPQAASIPVPKLKNIERLRTVHYVYELPDNHPLLEGMDVREADDPCFYLLAIWSPGEVPESIPNINDDNEETGFTSGNFSSEEESIKATLLVPCRTAMQGSFPLNGTYFQVNEVFADQESSLQPILVPRVLLWNLRRRFVYFGTSVTSILRGMTTEEIQACFWRGYVCVRGFDRMTRAPKPLVRRLHFQTTKSIMKSASSVKNNKT